MLSWWEGVRSRVSRLFTLVLLCLIYYQLSITVTRLFDSKMFIGRALVLLLEIPTNTLHLVKG